MVKFETLKSKVIEFGETEFIEVARKTATSDAGEREFLSLSRGYVTDDGSRRYKSNFSLPADDAVVEHIIEYLPAMLADED